MVQWLLRAASIGQASGCHLLLHMPNCLLPLPPSTTDAGQLLLGHDCGRVCLPVPPALPHLELLPNPGARPDGCNQQQQCWAMDACAAPWLRCRHMRLHPLLMVVILLMARSLPPAPFLAPFAVVGPGLLRARSMCRHQRGRLVPGPAVWRWCGGRLFHAVDRHNAAAAGGQGHPAPHCDWQRGARGVIAALHWNDLCHPHLTACTLPCVLA